MIDVRVEELVAESPESAQLWKALEDSRLELQRCTDCGRLRFPPLAACPYCAATGSEWERVEPRGTLYSWVVTHAPFDEALADEVPYTIGTVELDGGPRMFARLDGIPAAELQASMALEGVFHRERGLPYLRFRRAEGDGD